MARLRGRGPERIQLFEDGLQFALLPLQVLGCAILEERSDGLVVAFTLVQGIEAQVLLHVVCRSLGDSPLDAVVTPTQSLLDGVER